MTKKEKLSVQTADLRKRAEESALETAEQSPEDIDKMSPAQIKKTLHELRVHQIELDMQNEELRRVQAEVDTAGARFFDFYDLAPVGYLTLSERGLIIEANLTAATMLGLVRSELLKQPLSRFIIPADQDIYYLHHKNIFETNEPKAYELRMLKKDGSTFWTRLEGIAAHGAKGETVCRIVQSDITARKQAEEKLRDSEEKYRVIFNNEVYAILIFDLETLRLLDVNDAFCHLYGYRREELISKMTIHDITAEHQVSDAATQQAIREGTIFIPLRYHRKKDGTVFPVEIVGGPYAWKGQKVMFAILHDITEQKQLKDALRESEEKLSGILNNIKDVVWSLSWPDMKVHYISPSAAQVYGLPTQEFYDRPSLWTEIVHSDDKHLSGKALKELQENGFAVRECRIVRSDGSIAWIHDKSKLIYDKGNTPIRVEGIASDITDRKQAEAEKAALEAQNRQLQKTESLSRMAGAIAHHFNNQLGVVIGYLEMVIDEMPKGAAHTNCLTKAMKSAWTAADMSGLMLTYLGQTHEKVEPLDLSYSCRKILPILKEAIPANVIMETDFQLPRPIIMANAGEMQQILTNLITNAGEAVGKNHGKISLSVKTVSPAEITTTNRSPVDWQSQDKSYACLEVADTGCGIDNKDIEKLFDPFFSTKFTGRGMGLPVVLGLANSYKGVITVESKPGKGSTFRIFLPVSEEALPQSQPAENDRDVSISKPSPGKMEEGGTVLVVEDEEMLRNMAGTMLESFGFTVLKAKDGIEALEVFGKHQSEIKFVLTDLTMPRMNGWETLNELRKLQPDIPVILASGYDLAHVMEGVHPELPQAFLAKPYNLKALHNAVSQTLESKKL